MRKCPHCNEIKPDDHFYKGTTRWCKACNRERSRKYRGEHLEERSRYLKRWNATHREYKADAHRKWREANRDHLNKYARKYNRRRREIDPEPSRQYHQTWRANNKAKLREYVKHNIYERRQKDAVRAKLRRAVKAGKIIKPDRCTRCDACTKLSAHHSDYSQPYLVEWLCHRCHMKEHRMD